MSKYTIFCEDGRILKVEAIPEGLTALVYDHYTRSIHLVNGRGWKASALFEQVSLIAPDGEVREYGKDYDGFPEPVRFSSWQIHDLFREEKLKRELAESRSHALEYDIKCLEEKVAELTEQLGRRNRQIKGLRVALKSIRT